MKEGLSNSDVNETSDEGGTGSKEGRDRTNERVEGSIAYSDDEQMNEDKMRKSRIRRT